MDTRTATTTTTTTSRHNHNNSNTRPAAAAAAPAPAPPRPSPPPPSPAQPPSTITKNIVRICGSCTSECGYCKGARAYVLDIIDENNNNNNNSNKNNHNDLNNNHTVSNKKSKTNQAQTQTQTPSTPQSQQQPEIKQSQQSQQQQQQQQQQQESQQPGASTTTNSKDSSKSYSILADSLLPNIYERFIYRGWRRSGTYMYKPDNWHSCCPALTIRLPVSEFQWTKSQKKVYKTMDKLLHPQQPKQNKTGKKRAITKKQDANNNNSQQQLLLQQQGILQQLERWATTILQSIILAPQQQMPKLCWKIKKEKDKKKKIKQPPTNQQNSTDTTTGSTNSNNNNKLTLFTTICAAIAGKSKGSIDRDQLSSQMLEKLLQSQQQQQQHCIQSIYRHAPSGQIFIDVNLPDPSSAAEGEDSAMHDVMDNNDALLDDVSMHDTTTTTTTSKNNKSKEDDRLLQWCLENPKLCENIIMVSSPSTAGSCGMNTPQEKYYNSLLSTSLSCSLNPRHNDILSLLSSSSVSAPYHIDVKTMPAHISALYPQVHKLYFEYQHKIHGDEDPYVDVKDNDDDDKKQKNGHADTKNNDPTNMQQSQQPQQQSERQSSQQQSHPPQPEQQQQQQHQEQQVESSQHETQSSPPKPEFNLQDDIDTILSSMMDDELLEWGQKSPSGWLKNALLMLRHEYQHLPVKKQHTIVKAFGSFYQFLIESPFPNIVEQEEIQKRRMMMQQPQQQQQQHAGAATNNQNIRDTTFDSSTSRKLPPPGSYHQHYYIHLNNGTASSSSVKLLIAVGVVDVLPNGLSSVYLFYEPSFSSELLPLGKYATLKEIEYTAELSNLYHLQRQQEQQQRQQQQLPLEQELQFQQLQQQQEQGPKVTLEYYYLGYYIESCQKMRYKADYKPSEILCPTTYEWIDSSIAQEMILRDSPVKHCCTLASSLSRNHTAATNNNSPSLSNPHYVHYLMERVPMDVGASILVTLGMLHEKGRQTVRPLLEEFVKETGPDICNQVVIKFN